MALGIGLWVVVGHGAAVLERLVKEGMHKASQLGRRVVKDEDLTAAEHRGAALRKVQLWRHRLRLFGVEVRVVLRRLGGLALFAGVVATPRKRPAVDVGRHAIAGVGTGHKLFGCLLDARRGGTNIIRELLRAPIHHQHRPVRQSGVAALAQLDDEGVNQRCIGLEVDGAILVVLVPHPVAPARLEKALPPCRRISTRAAAAPPCSALPRQYCGGTVLSRSSEHVEYAPSHLRAHASP